MTLDTWLAFVAASLVLTMSPGPSVLIASVHALHLGCGRALFTALGDISANGLQMVLVAVGLGAVIASSELAFQVIKWFGVATLAYLGLKLLLSQPERQPRADTPSARQLSRTRCFVTGFTVAAGNPKAIVFFTAFFPQFIDPSEPLLAQMLILCPTMAAIDLLWVMAYASAARHLLGARSRTLTTINRVTGGLFLGAAGALSVSTR
ncbi:MAG: LysE family transporter [Pseudomonadota bacterium]